MMAALAAEGDTGTPPGPDSSVAGRPSTVTLSVVVVARPVAKKLICVPPAVGKQHEGPASEATPGLMSANVYRLDSCTRSRASDSSRDTSRTRSDADDKYVYAL